MQCVKTSMNRVKEESVCVCVRPVMTVYIIHVCVFAARLFKSGREGVKSVQDPRRSSTSLSPRQ